MDSLYRYLENPKYVPQGTCRIEWVKNCSRGISIIGDKYIPLARIGSRVGHYRLALGTIGSRLAYWLTLGGPHWVCKAFPIPTCRYSQRKIVALGV